MNRLVVFDIDSTLTDTNGIDEECYCNAVAGAIGVPARELDWSGAAHVTDSEIFNWLCIANGRSLPGPEAVARARKDFVEGLTRELSAHAGRFGEVRGARAAIESLPAAGWDVAVA